MRKGNSLEIQTPEGESSLIFRDLIALELQDWADDVSIENVFNSGIIKISHIPPEEVGKIIEKMRRFGIRINSVNTETVEY